MLRFSVVLSPLGPNGILSELNLHVISIYKYMFAEGGESGAENWDLTFLVWLVCRSVTTQIGLYAQTPRVNFLPESTQRTNFTRSKDARLRLARYPKYTNKCEKACKQNYEQRMLQTNGYTIKVLSQVFPLAFLRLIVCLLFKKNLYIYIFFRNCSTMRPKNPGT